MKCFALGPLGSRAVRTGTLVSRLSVHVLSYTSRAWVTGSRSQENLVKLGGKLNLVGGEKRGS